ncbi:Mss4-like protein [Paraphoma chrysanthemicola]|uniref:Mss4-like protein n=1 Tax=Paraphoma chrysanthemicola TaxID=798071 RepID=A0A8K0VT56_9PLEO|nr:Mss4-like protein [Paraphoma chrysanthemicola]
MSSNQTANVATRTFYATCHCRASAFSFDVPISNLPLPVHFCHCSICRRSTGTLSTAGAIIPDPIIDLSSVTAYKSSEQLTRYFCSTCGAHFLGSIQLGETRKWFVSAPSVDAEEEIWDFSGHVFVGSTGDGGLAPLLQNIGEKELKSWDTWAGRSAPWPATQNIAVSKPAFKESSRLRAHCHCGGIDFCISRPNGNETFTDIDEHYVRKHKDKWLGIHDVCTSCRLTISTWVTSWIFPSRDKIILADGSPYPADGIFGTAKAYSSSVGVNRTFCGTCGAAVSYVSDDRSHVVDVAAGLLDHTRQDVRAEDWIEWRSYKLAWEEDAVWKNAKEALKRGLQANELNIGQVVTCSDGVQADREI